MIDLGAARAALTTLRQQRDAAKTHLLDSIEIYVRRAFPNYAADDLDTLLRLHGQVVTLENAEKLETQGNGTITWAAPARFLRATVGGDHV